MTATVMSRSQQELTVPESLEKMEMLKVQANLKHDNGLPRYSVCSLINGIRSIRITYPPCPCRCPKGHGAPAGLVAVAWGGCGQCFVQLLGP